MTRTLKSLAIEALAVQDACNLTAVVNGMSRALTFLREHVSGSDALASHPIILLWADKISHLTGTQDLGNDKVMKAYSIVHDMVNGDTGWVRIEGMTNDMPLVESEKY